MRRSIMSYDYYEDLERKPGRPVQQKISMCIFRVNGVECSLWNRNCSTCGWNPDVEKQRISDIKSGKASPFLKIDLDAFKRMSQAEFRKHEKDGGK